MDHWRNYFRGSNSDIFEVIEKAIHVAASDWPQEFRERRDRLAEVLFTCQLARCGGLDRVNDRADDNGECHVALTEETEALTEETAEEGQLVREVFRIKEILCKKEFENDTMLLEYLKRLQSMALSVDVLKETEIGKAVNGLRKHQSRDIRLLVRALIDGWKVVVDEWVHANIVLAESTPESMNNEQGQISTDNQSSGSNRGSIPVMQFFDRSDDHERTKNRPTSIGSTTSEEKSRVWKQTPETDQPNLQDLFVHPAGKPNKPNNKTAVDSRSRQRQEKLASEKMPVPEESSVRAKLEVAKRKLHERYQEAENAKKQRTIQVMEIKEIPNQSRQNNQKHVWSRTSSNRN